MFLIGIVAGLGDVVLIIDRATGLPFGLVISPHSLCDHDSRSSDRIGHRVAANFTGHIEIFEISARSGYFPKPTHCQRVGRGQSIDRNDRAKIRCLHACGEWINVASGVVAGATRNITPDFMAGGGLQALSNRGLGIEDPAIGIGLNSINEGVARIGDSLREDILGSIEDAHDGGAAGDS